MNTVSGGIWAIYKVVRHTFQGKGFPDVNTRLMVRRLSETLHIPILALADADPHGKCNCLFIHIS